MPKIELVKQNRINPQSTWLLRHASNSTSQFGEDGIICKVFNLIGTHNRWCFEAGAWDGISYSNTNSLMKQGWSGVFVEANADKFRDLQQTYRSNRQAILLNSIVGLQSGMTLDVLLG